MDSFARQVVENWVMWTVSVTLVVAAVIDGLYLKVPNKITYPLIVCGWMYSAWIGGWAGLGWSLLATFFGLFLLFGLHLIGGMGAGDVKLLAGIAAFVHIEHTWYIFVATTIVGAVMAIIQIAVSGQWLKHYTQAQSILREIVTVRDADKLYEISQERKPRMRLLPYGIPMTIAAIGYFAFAGLL
ncbi:MAG: prepilin peptidase [Pirellulaceae bacterium]|nr:prepilin peptidase [Pirellulaceae bacterium]